ncbi:MAG TPA: hypothetical protein VG734_08565 [Lacunisphaera sp.]|nr:hypothetical protein [Lacunisphaera sp.]
MSNRDSKTVTLSGAFEPRFWEDADGRVAIVREIRTRYEQLKADAQADSTQKDLIAQRAVFVAIQLETMERTACETGKIDAGVYTQMVNCLTGLLKALGLERKAKPVGDLKSYVNGRAKS